MLETPQLLLRLIYTKHGLLQLCAKLYPFACRSYTVSELAAMIWSAAQVPTTRDVVRDWLALTVANRQADRQSALMPGTYKSTSSRRAAVVRIDTCLARLQYLQDLLQALG